MAKSATTPLSQTFDISKVSPEVLEGPATWNQIKGISYHFGKTGFSLKGKVDRAKQAQIRGCLYSLVKQGKFTFQQAHKIRNAQTFSKTYRAMIDTYLAENQEVEAS